MNINYKFKIPIYEIILLNYLLFNIFLNKKKTLGISSLNYSLFIENTLLVVISLASLTGVFLVLFKKARPFKSHLTFFLIFFFIQATQINLIKNDYFWSTIPDSRTYRYLGETLLSCGKLALDCSSESFLQWTPGQPIISGILSLFFYEGSKFVYILIFAFSFYFMSKITHKRFGNFYHAGILFFLLLPNNYELSGFIISEVPYIFFTSLGLFFLYKESNNLSFLLFLMSFLIRPIGIVNVIGYFLYIFLQKNKKQIAISFLIFISTLLTVATYNFVFNDKFIISTTVSTNIENDSRIQVQGIYEFLYGLGKSENREFIFENITRLYGPGSRDCVFEYCLIYNPLFKEDGTVPKLIPKNNFVGYGVNIFLSELFKIGSPLGVWVFLPFTYILLLRKENNFDNLIIFLFFSNVFLSILTAEYGSRWWLLPNLLSIYLFSNLIYEIKHKLIS